MADPIKPADKALQPAQKASNWPDAPGVQARGALNCSLAEALIPHRGGKSPVPPVGQLP